jgi:hypothetical protein
MALHLIEISSTVAPGAHAVLLLDQIGWHMTGKLAVPTNITLLPLPAKSPELTPSRISGSSCGTIGSQTVSSRPTGTSSITAATPGTS